MSKQELAERFMAMDAGLNLYLIRTGQLNAEQRRMIVESVNRLGEANLWLEDSPIQSIAHLSAIARRHKRRQALDLVVVDYLQLIQSDESDRRQRSRQEDVAMVSRRLKLLARDLDVAVLVLAQVSRTSAETGRAPKLNELRESGAIEQDADVVLFVHRPGVYDKSKVPQNAWDPETAEIIVAKNRNGPTGKVDVNWYRATASFSDLPGQFQEEQDDWQRAASGETF
jgi:replicative DNA helicase